jgi:two-component system CheB/CheR fusion protein
MVDTELRMALSGALLRVLKEMTPVVYKGLHIQLPEGDKQVNVSVRPVRHVRSSVVHTLISFEEVDALIPTSSSVREIDLDQASKEQVLALEAELRHTKENLQAMIEELETSNEELQATNEELVASNEELQSTNEELHSVNEELYTVNAEYQNKITQLTELTTDMDNLLTSTEVHTIFLDRNLCIRKFTPKIAETFNLLPQDVGRRIDNFTYTIDHPGLLDDLQTVLSSSSALERQVRDRRGNWYLLRVLPYRAGLGIDGVVLTLVDVTGMKKAGAQARLKDEQLRGILRNSPNWVFIRDRQGRYVLADESFRKAVNCDPIGKTAHDLFPLNIADILTMHDKRVLEEGVEEQSEVVIPLPDGPHNYLSVKFPVRDEEGRIIGVGGIKTDVTQLKHAERQAREALRQRDRFLAVLSHELRNPLAAILNAASAVDQANALPDEVRHWLDVIERRSRHMARLLEDLLDVSRITQNKIEIRKVVFNLASTIPDVLEEVRHWFAERELTLINETGSGPMLVEGDPDRLQQIQVNLLMNAAKYTPAGGKVWYVLGREEDQVVIRVSDTGVGLMPEMLNQVFDLFTQVDETLDRSAGGIGVGLTLVRAIVELHGGTVEAHSDGPGTGSEFIVRLPMATGPIEDAIPPPARKRARACQGTGQRVLVVEDDPDIRESLRRILQLDGFHVRVAENGLEALAVAEADFPQVAVIDIGIPGLDGYELARRFRERYPRDLLLVALTGYGQPSDRQAAFEAGFDEHLTKPFSPTALARLLSERTIAVETSEAS